MCLTSYLCEDTEVSVFLSNSEGILVSKKTHMENRGRVTLYFRGQSGFTCCTISPRTVLGRTVIFNTRCVYMGVSRSVRTVPVCMYV